MKWTIGPYTFGGESDIPDPGPKEDVWHKVNVVVPEPIPGRGKRTITVRTSDGVLWECDLTIRSITDKRYQQLKFLINDGGPFDVNCHHGMYKMYITEANITHDEKDKEMPLQERKQEVNEATWVLKLLEAND